MIIAKFKKKPVLGILRGITLEQIEPLVEAIISSGLETIEIAMNTPSAPELIHKAVGVAQKRLMIGAGTVLDTTSFKLALDAGATFIVMPVLIKDVLASCLKSKIPAFPGALTPQEIYYAWKEGATMVKVFPAKFFGPEYFREIKGPFNPAPQNPRPSGRRIGICGIDFAPGREPWPLGQGGSTDIELLACGGVTAQNIREYFSSGASAIAFGASVFKKDWLEKKDYQSICSTIKAYLEQLP